jgi:hypothetical protein
MCTGISEFYAEESLTNADVIIAFYKMVGAKRVVLGFLLAKYQYAEKMLHISLICTHSRYKGIGKRLIQMIKNIASENLEIIDKITLDSVNTAKTFYSGLGFEGNMDNSPPDRMVYNMANYTGGNRKTKRRTTKPKKRRSNTRRRR